MSQKQRLGLLVLLIGLGLLKIFIQYNYSHVNTETKGDSTNPHQNVVGLNSRKSAGPKSADYTSSGTASSRTRPRGNEAEATPQEDVHGTQILTSRESAVHFWDDNIDTLITSGEMPSIEQIAAFKKAFDLVDQRDRMDCICRALNLLPDEQFVVLRDILLDTKEDELVLDALFCDMLNRSDEIKYTMMDDIIGVDNHPLRWEAARIQDAIADAEQ